MSGEVKDERQKIFPGSKLTCESYGDLGRLSEINKVELIPLSSLVPPGHNGSAGIVLSVGLRR
jgi:hypothetical protein